ncbi:hypothetical protein L7F22_055683, partial [Adiantum nelumboides]|nr:hypothetical protein [Adiantum nelumboides]
MGNKSCYSVEKQAVEKNNGLKKKLWKLWQRHLMWTTVKKCKRYLVVLGMTFKLEDGGHGSWAMASACRVQTFPFGEKMAGLQYSTANEWGVGTTVKIEAFVRRSEWLPESGAVGLGEKGLEGDRRVGEG